ncbi:hypothetical protein B0T24DRAFT_716263 [Lasiosphaeria ovina]|uniref:Uncharacterized protein n=1 Tax=Lasiosphaeria ovina TaxID=92902 RepID=A0AAE0NN68_9PEZI|nr:hypothetical protein B0T24DRAFT_716263 [Lasiosphaeria ovina]
MPERGESPPPEQVSGKQLHDVPGWSGQEGSGNADNKASNEQSNKTGLESLSSNPKGPLDDIVTEKFSKSSSKNDKTEKEN